jgi:2-hydroxy-3-oxopropionate reductase
MQPATVAPGHTTVAYIGLGIMGRPMARNLVEAGYRVRVHNRSRPAVDDLVAAGAEAATGPADAADGADVVITNLPDSPDAEAVVLGEGGVRDGLRPGGTLIDMSTISPAVARRIATELAAGGVGALDAPVSGGQQGAIDGTLSIMVGGDRAVFDACLPLLEVMGGTVSHVGDAGAGQVAKSCNQIVVAGTIQAVGEALTLARRSGVDPANVREALLGGFAGSRILEVHGQRMIDGDYAPGFKAALHRKDLGIALDAGAEAGVPLLSTALVKELLGSLLASGDGGLDSSALATVVETLAGEGPAGG